MVECNQIHTFYPDEKCEEDDWGGEQQSLFEPDLCNGNNEMVRIFNQNCVICSEKPRVYAFPQGGRPCIYGKRYQNEGDLDILKSIICRT